MPPSDVEPLVARIAAAFADVPRPDPAALHNDHCCECAETSEAYGALPWPEIRLEHLLAGRETSLLTVAAWRYYLPAMMTWCLRQPVEADVLVDYVAWQLTPPAGERGVPDWFAPRAVGFTSAQRAAIVAYLEWYRAHEAALWAPSASPNDVGGAIAWWSGAERALPATPDG